MNYTFKVQINEKGEVLNVEPETGGLACDGIPEYSPEGQAKKNKFKKKKSIHLELWQLENEKDPCIRHGGRLWCW